MRVALVRVGKDRAVPIPQSFATACGFEKIVDLQVENGRLVVTAVAQSRDGWEEVFRKAVADGDAGLLDAQARNTDFDEAEWTW